MTGLRIPDIGPDHDSMGAALAYAAAGFYTLPVDRASKHAGSVLGKGWPHKSSRDPETIIGWFAGASHALALHVGRSGAIAFDVDHPGTLPAVLTDAIRDTPPPFQSTRDGEPGRGHYLYTVPAGRSLGNRAGGLGKTWGEVRGRNGIIVVAPSEHAKAADGGRYTWMRTGPLPELPATLAALLPDVADADDAATDAEVKAFLDRHTTGTRPELLSGILTQLARALGEGGSRHMAVLLPAANAMREAAAGLYPALTAAEQIRAVFAAAMSVSRDGRERVIGEAAVRAEFAGVLAWAVAQVDDDAVDATRHRITELPHENVTELLVNYRPDVHGPFTDGNVALATVTELRPEQRAAHPTMGHRGQLQFAERFTGVYAGRLLHVHGIGWHEFDGARWAECLDGSERRAVLHLVNTAFAELPALGNDARKDLLRDIAKIESANGVKGVLELAAAMHPCTLAGHQLDASPYLLNTTTGTIDIEAGTSTPPDPGDHLSKVTRAAFDPGARSEVFEDFLARIQPDPGARAFLARQLGSSLLGVVREHVLFIWRGLGANGKGTLRDAILHALGDYAVEVPADLLLVGRNQNLGPERMRLKGARVAFCSEIGTGAKLDEPTMKKLTGGDPVNAKLLYRNPIQFDPSHTLFMLTNHLPQVRGDDPATWRRILAVPFDTVIPAEERDGELPEKLKSVPDAILSWIWAGWLDYQKQGLNPPQSVLNATRKYQLDSDLLARFLADEETVCLGHGSTGSAVLYRAFGSWCKEQGEEAGMTNKAFTEAMEIHGHRKKRTSTGIAWEQVLLVDKNADQDRTW